ncbi:MAG: acyltransferase [Promethearchaeota archaeon]
MDKKTKPNQKISEDYQPIISYNMNKRGAQFIIIMEFCITIIAMRYINEPYYLYMFTHTWMYIFLPISIYGLIWQFYGLTLVFSWIIYQIFKMIEPPKEGEFTLESREFRFYSYRFWIIYYMTYIARAMPLPWVDYLAYRIFSLKTGGNNVLYDSWIDPEFLEIGENCMISLNTQLFSHCIYRNKFVVKRIIIEDSGIAGAGAIVAPGTVIGKGAVLGASSSTKINQNLKQFCTHVGSPVKLALPIKVIDEKARNEEGKAEGKMEGKMERKMEGKIEEKIEEKIEKSEGEK